MTNLKKILAIGSATTVLTLALICVSPHDDRYVKVTSFGDNKAPAVGEPEGYIGGEWNLWEFIGDSINRMLFGS